MSEGYRTTGTFAFWCQHVIPLVYDNSLSYYECLCKVVNYLNDVIYNTELMEKNIGELNLEFTTLKDFVEHYFDTPEMQAKINNKLDSMVADGTFERLFSDVILTEKSMVKDFYLDNAVALHMFDGYTQGMTTDGTYLYITRRATTSDTTPFTILKVDPTDYSVVESHTLTAGHYNAISYYNGFLYCTGYDTDYKKIVKVNLSNWTTTVVTLPYSTWGMFFSKANDNIGALCYMQRGRLPKFNVFSEYVDDRGKFYPLSQIDLEPQGQDIMQGSFWNDFNFIYSVHSAYPINSYPNGHNYVAVFDYGGNLVGRCHLKGTVGYELEQCCIVGNKLYVNGVASGKTYLFVYDWTEIKWSMYTSTNTHNIFKSGTIKNIYANGYAIDTLVSFGGEKLQDTITLCDYTFLDEIANYNIEFNLMGNVALGGLNYAKSRLYVDTVKQLADSTISAELYYDRSTNESGHNYVFTLKSLTLRVNKNDGTSKLYSGVDGWKQAVTDGYAKTIYPRYIGYTVGLPYNYSALII